MSHHYFTCPNCETKIALTSDSIDEIDNQGFIECSCGASVCPDDPNYLIVKKEMKSKSIVTFCIFAVAIVCAFFALKFKAPGLLPVIALGAGAIVRSQNSGDFVELNSKLSSSVTVSSAE